MLRLMKESTSLYRAYRPQSFADVLGQDHITKTLEEAVSAGKVGHAYLFSGSRGLGKTSVARILAKVIGCTDQDLYEIDAASNNSVDDIRTISDNVYTLPFESQYKVYLMDEVHMLSKNAWNAFLKTLEEPPKHAIFILATTEIEKVPETVQSRCQIFEFKKPTRKSLAKMVIDIAKKEGVTLAPDAADLIAMLAEGSYRDALSVLQKVITSTNKKTLSRAETEVATGAPKREQIHTFVHALAAGERDKALVTINQVEKSGVDMKLFLELTLETLRSILLIRYAPDLRDSLSEEIGTDEFSELETVAKLTTSTGNTGITHDTLLAFLTATERIRYAPIPALPLELAVLELFPD